jgi:hypothetical protein
MATQQTYASLDMTGTQAAVYPSEDALWVQGPPINDPLDQGVLPGYDLTITPQQQTATEDWLHEVMNGQTPNGADPLYWVNPEQFGPTGFGPWNDETVFQSGHSQLTTSNPSAEQGWGVGPARRWAHYPHMQLTNPFRDRMVHMRNGELPWVTESSYLYYRTQLAVEQQWAPYKARSPVTPVVPIPPNVPFVATVPTYAGGPIPIPGVDVPTGDEGIY